MEKPQGQQSYGRQLREALCWLGDRQVGTLLGVPDTVITSEGILSSSELTEIWRLDKEKLVSNQHTELLGSCGHISGNSSVLSMSQVTLNLTVTLVVTGESLPPGAAGFSSSWYEPSGVQGSLLHPLEKPRPSCAV